MMQKRALRTVKTPALQTDEVVHFSLPGLLPDGQILALDTHLGTLSLLSSEQGMPRLLLQQQFTTGELCMLLPLLDCYPNYCPYEVLLASFTTGRVNERGVERCRERLQEAQEAGVWDQEMRPVRNVLSRMRLKIRVFGLMDISSILETGYIILQTDQHAESRLVVAW